MITRHTEFLTPVGTILIDENGLEAFWMRNGNLLPGRKIAHLYDADYDTLRDVVTDDTAKCQIIFICKDNTTVWVPVGDLHPYTLLPYLIGFCAAQIHT